MLACMCVRPSPRLTVTISYFFCAGAGERLFPLRANSNLTRCEGGAEVSSKKNYVSKVGREFIFYIENVTEDLDLQVINWLKLCHSLSVLVLSFSFCFFSHTPARLVSLSGVSRSRKASGSPCSGNDKWIDEVQQQLNLCIAQWGELRKIIQIDFSLSAIKRRENC